MSLFSVNTLPQSMLGILGENRLFSLESKKSGGWKGFLQVTWSNKFEMRSEPWLVKFWISARKEIPQHLQATLFSVSPPLLQRIFSL